MCAECFLGPLFLFSKKYKEDLFVKVKSTKVVVFIAMFMAVTIVLSFFNQFVPSLPQGGSISFDIIAIFLCSYLLGGNCALAVGVGVAILQFILGMAIYYGPWSVLFDYVLPLTVCGLAGYFANIKIGKYEFYIGIFVSMILKFLSHFVSGAFVFAMYTPEGVNPIIYSLGYNLPYNLLTLFLCMFVVPILHKRLKKSIK